MTSAPADGIKHIGEVVHKVTEVNPCRRLQIVAALLVIVGVLGIAVVVGNYISPSGEGLSDLLDEPKADVMGQVKTADGTPLVGARVTDVRSDESYVTGVSGWYFLEDIRTGRVELRMEADDYKTVIKTVTIERGESIVDIVAVPGTGEIEVEGTVVPGPGDPGKGTVLLVGAIIIASGLALVAAYFAYSHIRYPIVLTSAVLGLLTWGWYVGSVAALIALILVLPLRREFRDNPQGCATPWREEPPPPIEDPGDSDGKGDGDGTEAIDVTTHQEPGRETEGTGGMQPGG